MDYLAILTEDIANLTPAEFQRLHATLRTLFAHLGHSATLPEAIDTLDGIRPREWSAA